MANETRTTHTTDLLVIDSTPGGLVAAIAAARLGLRAMVVTEDTHVGGMQTAGLGNTNTGQRATIGGLPAEFHRRLLAWYTATYGADSAQVRDSQNGFHFESSAAEAVYEQWLAEADVTVLRGRHVASVERDGARLTAVTLDDGSRVAASWFVDASYEGDLLYAADCRLTVGRESAALYGESLAGVRFPPERRGEADGLTQAYDFRLCLTRDPGNRLPFREPADYDPGTYEDWRQHFLRRPPDVLPRVIPLNMMPNGKTDSRAGEWVGGCTDYPTASRERRAEIVAAHRHYAEGWVWFLLTDPCIPATLRAELAEWGYAADEFVDNDHWPYHIYVRESSRLVGDWVMTQADVQTRRFQPDSVGLGSFYLDVHPVQTLRDPDDPSRLIWEGGLDSEPLRAYEIPYRVMLPRAEDAANAWSLFVLSASHVAYSTLRMEPYFMMLGQAAGTAAALIDAAAGRHASDVDIADLQAQLRRDGALLDAADFPDYWPHPPA